MDGIVEAFGRGYFAAAHIPEGFSTLVTLTGASDLKNMVQQDSGASIQHENCEQAILLEAMGSAILSIRHDDRRSMELIVFVRFTEACRQVLLGIPASKQKKN